MLCNAIFSTFMARTLTRRLKPASIYSVSTGKLTRIASYTSFKGQPYYGTLFKSSFQQKHQRFITMTHVCQSEQQTPDNEADQKFLEKEADNRTHNERYYGVDPKSFIFGSMNPITRPVGSADLFVNRADELKFVWKWLLENRDIHLNIIRN
jgi:hypothetical protein